MTLSGCALEWCKNRCVSVGLLYEVVIKFLWLSSFTVVSRKLILSVLVSEVNLIVG